MCKCAICNEEIQEADELKANYKDHEIHFDCYFDLGENKQERNKKLIEILKHK